MSLFRENPFSLLSVLSISKKKSVPFTGFNFYTMSR